MNWSKYAIPAYFAMLGAVWSDRPELALVVGLASMTLWSAGHRLFRRVLLNRVIARICDLPFRVYRLIGQTADPDGLADLDRYLSQLQADCDSLRLNHGLKEAIAAFHQAVQALADAGPVAPPQLAELIQLAYDVQDAYVKAAYKRAVQMGALESAAALARFRQEGRRRLPLVA